MSIIRYQRGETPLSDDQHLKTLESLSDDKIDYSDIPSTEDAQWENALRGKFLPSAKKQTPFESS